METVVGFIPDLVDEGYAEAHSSHEIRDVTLNSLNLALPGGDVSINGEPYRFEVDDGALAKAVNKANTARIRRDFPVETIGISFGDSMPRSIVDIADNELPLLYDGKNKHLGLTMPDAVVATSLTQKQLVEKYNKALAIGLETGLLQSVATRNTYIGRIRRRLSALAISPLVGFAVGETIPKQTGDVSSLLLRGTAGACIGALAVSFATLCESAMRDPTSLKNIKGLIPKKVQRMQKSDPINPFVDGIRTFTEVQPIKLVPVEPTQEDTEITDTHSS